jgi:hypothetical protein
MTVLHVPAFVPPTADEVLPCTRQPDLFFAPDDTDESTVERTTRVAQARRFCDACPDRRRHQCRAWALRHHEWGVWGGHTERENRARVR